MSTPDLPIKSYWDIVEVLEARIRAAATAAQGLTAEEASKLDYGPGAKIPIQAKLAEEFGVHFATVARAIAILKDRGLLVSRPPVGVFVAKTI